MAKTTAEKSAAPKFGKEQLLRAARYSGRRDLLNTLLQNGEKYSLEEVDTAIENYMKGKVK